jgi:hypothetical protein
MLAHRDASHALAITPAEPGPSLRTARYRLGVRASRLLTAFPSRRQPPSRFRPGLLQLRPTVGRTMRAAAVLADRRARYAHNLPSCDLRASLKQFPYQDPESFLHLLTMFGTKLDQRLCD